MGHDDPKKSKTLQLQWAVKAKPSGGLATWTVKNDITKGLKCKSCLRLVDEFRGRGVIRIFPSHILEKNVRGRATKQISDV